MIRLRELTTELTTNSGISIQISEELCNPRNARKPLLYADKAVMQRQSIASVYRDRDRWDFHPVGLFLSLHRPGFTLDTSLSYDLGMELQATRLCTQTHGRACQGIPETLLTHSIRVLLIWKSIKGF